MCRLGKVLLVCLAALGVVFSAVGLSGCDNANNSGNGTAQTALPVNPSLGGDFTLPSTLKNEDGAIGKPFSLKEITQPVTLLNFGYTECPDVCPLVLSRMAQVLNGLGDEAARVQGAFVTFDPDRDSLQKLAEYLPFFHEGFIGFGGTLADIEKAAKLYGVIFLPEQPSPEAKLLYSHSDFIYLLDNQQRVRALFATDTPVEKMIADVQTLLKEQVN